MCNWPPVHEVCPNFEVVVFQPRIVTPPHLGTVAIVTKFISSPPAPPDSTIFLYISFPSSILTPPPSISRSSSYPSHFLYLLPASSPGTKRCPPGRHPHPPTATRHPSASTTRLYAPRFVPASSAVSRDCSLPPLFPSAFVQVPDVLWGFIFT